MHFFISKISFFEIICLLSLMEFAKDTGTMFDKYVNYVLNSLTNNEHSNYLKAAEKPATNEVAPQNSIQISDEPK